MKRILRSVRLVVLALPLLLAAPVSALTLMWTNTAGGDWVAATNWSPQQVPTASDDVVISGTAAYTITVTGSRSASGLVMDNANATLRLRGQSGTSHATLTVANGFANFGTIELTSQGSTFNATLNVTSGVLTNAVGGLVRVLEGTAGGRTLGLELDNRGTLQIERSTSLIKSGGKHRFAGTVDLAAGTTLTIGAGGLVETTHAGANWTGTGTLDLPSGRPFILETDFTLSTITLNLQSVTVQGPGTLTVPLDRTLTFQATTMDAPFNLLGTLESGGSSSINGSFSIPAGGFVRVLGRSGFSHATLTVANGFANLGTIELTSQDSSFSATLNVTSGALTNAIGGVLQVLGGAGGARTLGVTLDNRGTMLVATNVTLNKTASLHRNSGLIEVTGGTFTHYRSGTGASFSNEGEIRVSAGAVTEALFGSFYNLPAGTFSGTGTFDLSGGNITNTGTVSPGASPGVLTIEGAAYPQAGVLALEIGGFSPGTQHDQLAVTVPLTLSGTLNASLINGFFPKKDDAFTVLTYTSRTGSFTNIESAEPDRIAWRIEYGSTNAQLIVENSAPTLAVITSQTVSEQTLLSVTASATDQDLPAQTLTYTLDANPPGMTINANSGQINWTPTEAQGPGVYNVTVRVTDDGSPALSHTNSFTVTVNEVNVAPQLTVPGPQSVNELVELVFAINATDDDLPANSLNYQMLSGPPGATFNPATREFRWTPTEAQGPGVSNVTFRVTDNNPDAVNTQQLSATNSVAITINELNVAPQLTVPGPQTVDEMVELLVTISATDSDLPSNTLTYQMLSGPTGATFDPATREFRWTPTEAQGPGVSNAMFRVIDDNPSAANTPQLSATNSVAIIINEVNVAPVLAVVPNATIHAGTTYQYTLSAADSDLPANTLSYSLVSGPADATVGAANGVVSWTAQRDAPGAVTNFTVRATDNGTPLLVSERSFQVTVAGPVEITEYANEPGGFRVEWRTVPGLTYRLLSTTNLPAAAWSPVGSDMTAVGGSTNRLDGSANAASRGFYRVLLIE